jgi:hypothetical protein
MPKKIDIYNMLAHRREIAIVWNIHDVKEVRPDLTDDQAWEVLQQVERKQDVLVGVDQDLLRCVAEELFGPPPDGDAKTAD